MFSLEVIVGRAVGEVLAWAETLVPHGDEVWPNYTNFVFFYILGFFDLLHFLRIVYLARFLFYIWLCQIASLTGFWVLRKSLILSFIRLKINLISTCIAIDI